MPEYPENIIDSVDKKTPMLEQYEKIKEKIEKDYPKSLLFFRVGDFYELFGGDAEIAHEELQIALTSRGKGSNTKMAGVPYHAVQSYLAKLIDKGYTVAICEQKEVDGPGIVDRDVTNIITPGTVLDETNLNAKAHNYLGAIFCGLHNSCAFAWADVSTGQWSGMEFRRQADLWQWVRKLSPKELLIADGQQLPANFNHGSTRIVYQPHITFELRRAGERLLETQGVQELNALGLENKPCLTRACGAILSYLEQTQLRKPDHLMPFKPFDISKRLLLDELTERNLEIFTRLNGQKGKGTLRHVVDETCTPMGGRLLEDMLRHPWRDVRNINKVQECVMFMYAHDSLRANIRESLKAVNELERLIMRFCLNRMTNYDFFSLRNRLEAIPGVLAPFHGMDKLPENLQKLLACIDPLQDCADLLRAALIDDPDQAKEQGIFRKGFNSQLDELLDVILHSDQKLTALLEKTRKETGIAKLKLGDNRMFGYYFEVPASSALAVPGDVVRRQSLANAERFKTKELAELEEEILRADEIKKQRISEITESLRAELAGQKERIVQTADMLAHLDYWQCLAEVSRRENWNMPVLTENCELHIIKGRHPVVESIIGRANFVANDFHMDQARRLCLLTGPNMAGKSTVLRQTALICLLAQMGSMVPVESATIGVVDRIFSRVGASDNLAQGQSTFMVEMMETARILRQASKRSLIILDELGRGTSTYDGMALAYAVVEDLASRCQKQLRTIFATHYHELTALEGKLEGLFTMNIAISSFDNNEIVFLHRLLPGPSDKSYGVEVARIAGVPYPVVQRARDVLKGLEQTRSKQTLIAMQLPGIEKKADAGKQLLEELKKIDLVALSPESALKKIKEWKERWV